MADSDPGKDRIISYPDFITFLLIESKREQFQHPSPLLLTMVNHHHHQIMLNHHHHQTMLNPPKILEKPPRESRALPIEQVFEQIQIQIQIPGTPALEQVFGQIQK